MNFQQYKNAIATMKIRHDKPWQYCPNNCENKLCVSEKNIDDGEIFHGMILLTSQYEPIIICEDCKHQLDVGTYSKEGCFV
jgi:hypothetical protein